MMKLLESVCNEFGVSEEKIYAPHKNIEALNARGAYIYLLREKQKLSYGKIAQMVGMNSRGNVYNEFIKAKFFYESNSYHFKEKIDKIMQDNDVFEMDENQFKAKELDEVDTTVADETPEPISVEQSPLSEPVIERNIDTILRPQPQPQSETDFIKELDDYHQFELEQDRENPDTIPEVNFKTTGSDNPDEVSVQMDEDTANFSTDSILNLVEFGSVELACYYAQINEREVREMERDGEVPPKSTEITKEANENSRNKLEETASKKIKLLQEPLKKVLKKRSVSVSPESALVLAFLMFAFSMFMTARSIRKDNEYFLEKLRKMNTELKN
ncbi:helix-turn-helix domain-containing protein [Raineya sp.]|jgi:hypothetical protein